MTPRSIRRSQERKAQKLARKQARLDALETPEMEAGASAEEHAEQFTSEILVSREVSSDAHNAEPTEPFENDEPALPTAAAAPKSQANRATGPKTPQGKAKSCLNAVKTGLTGHTVLLSSDDAERYQQHIADFFDDLQPVGRRESALVQSIADSTWRLDRISTLEMALFARGREEFAELFADRDPALRSSLIALHTLLTYTREKCGIQIRENRLRARERKAGN